MTAPSVRNRKYAGPRTWGVVLGLCSWIAAAGALAETPEWCTVTAGGCKIRTEVNTGTCFCTTPFGPLSGVTSASAPTGINLLDSIQQVGSAPITLQIFAESDGKSSLSSWISGLSPSIEVVYAMSRNRAVLRGDAVDALWYTADMPEALVRTAALAIVEAGVKLRSIDLYAPNQAEGRPPRQNTLQLGRSTANRGLQTLAAQQIRVSAFPMLGRAGVSVVSEELFDRYKGNNPGFVQAVASRLGISFDAEQEMILRAIEGPGWERLPDGPTAAARARDGYFVIGALRGTEQAAPSNLSLAVVVVDGPLNAGKYPTAYWGNGFGRAGRNETINWAWAAADRDRVKYAARRIDPGPVR